MIRPLANQYLVRLTEPDPKSAGGVWLPDNWVENWTDGVVEAAGPGLWVGEGGIRSVMWAGVGDAVLFQRHQFRPFGEGSQVGMVGDDNLVGKIAAGSGEFSPLNEWVQIDQDPARMSEGSLALPEEYHPKPMHGRIVAVGHGRPRRAGPLYGTRQPVPRILGLMVLSRQLIGLRVYWDPYCEVLAVGRRALEFVLIAAGDLLAYEGELN